MVIKPEMLDELAAQCKTPEEAARVKLVVA
jgi:hypothetical protein